MSPIRAYTEPVSVRGVATPRGEIPELRSGASPIEVTLCRTARESILDDLFRSTRTDSLESGGFLFSRPSRSWHRSAELLHATRTGDAQRGSDSVLLDTEMWRSAETAFEIDGLDLALAGSWHSHPETRDGQPSDADLRAWLAALDWNEAHGRSTACAVGLIFSASEYLGDSWARPQAHCWVVRREGYGWRAVCEQGTLRCRG